MKDIADPVLVS